MKGITKSGFEFDVEPGKLDDWEILDQLSEMGDGNMLYAPKFVKKLLGPQGGKYLIEHCREEGGRVPTQKVLDEIFDIFNQIKEGKNS